MRPGVNPRIRTDLLVLVAFCGFLFFYGSGAFGLIGPDEPRYAQVAREMLDRGDWVTPTLHGRPWLEKPPLYYWQAMLAFRLGGVSDRAARLPGAVDASLLIAAIYFFLRRFRRGREVDGALIAASCAAVVGFARAAATDMPLAAAFSIAMLAWYAWYESGRRAYLAGFYVFLALAMLAKGPVAPALAALIIVFFLALKRDWQAIGRTLWIPGLALFLAVMLPWYVAVQLRNPEFFRVFILEHNLARFAHDVYHHRQPFWFYVPVFLLATVPWTLALIPAVAERIRAILAEERQAFSTRKDCWGAFLLLWMIVPIVFFSASQSKLPGYILPALPAAALLVADHLAGRRSRPGFDQNRRFSLLFAAAHGLLCGLLVFAAFSANTIVASHHVVWGRGTYTGAAVAAALAIGTGVTLRSRAGVRLFRPATLVAVVLSVGAAVRMAAPAIDAAQSARQIAETIQGFSREAVPLAVYHVREAQQFGLEFYLNCEAQELDSNISAGGQVVVAAQGSQSEVERLATGHPVSFLTRIPEQKVDVYWVGK